MNSLKERIIADGEVLSGNTLKVDSFLNHRIDTAFALEIGREFKKIFSDCDINKILTIEASGIAVSFATSQSFDFCPVVFAKKGAASNMGPDVYHASLYSYTRRADYEVYVSKKYLNENDKVLTGCELVGCGVVIEKAMQKGGEMLREKGIRVEALARVESMDAEKGIEFC